MGKEIPAPKSLQSKRFEGELTETAGLDGCQPVPGDRRRGIPIEVNGPIDLQWETAAPTVGRHLLVFEGNRSKIAGFAIEVNGAAMATYETLQNGVLVKQWCSKSAIKMEPEKMTLDIPPTPGRKLRTRENSAQSWLEDSIRASLERADEEIRLVLKKLVDSPGTSEALSPQGPPECLDNVKPPAAQYIDSDPRTADMFRDADTQTPVDVARDEPEQKNWTKPSSPAASQKETASGAQEHNIPIRLEMDAADWYLRRSGAQEIWDVHSQVYIETTERTCVHLKDGKAARPPYMQVTIEDVHTHCGDTARFDAVIEGTPPLTIAWYKDNILLKESARIRIVKEVKRYSLLLQNAEHEDGGVYTCIARNLGGEVTCKAELVMHEDLKEPGTQKLNKRRKLKSFYEIKEEIGRGSFGFVKRVVHKGNGATCAAKFIPLRSKTRQQVYRERDVLSEITHDRVTLLLDVFETKKTLILILEIIRRARKEDAQVPALGVDQTPYLSLPHVKLYIRQLVDAVGYLHEKNILHLDIKPSNILMVHPDEDGIKLCDFGFAQKLSPSELQYSRYGSPEFVPPEIARQSPVSKASDIWPIGVTSYLCLVCTSPFAGQNDLETLLNVQQGNISWHSAEFIRLSEEAKDFMRRTIQMSPEARPSAMECIQHSWFLELSSSEKPQTINTNSLKFLVARSRWQRSLMCYKSILVMRSIPELLQGKLESTSLGVARHLVDCSSSSSSSGSSSDNESDSSPTARDCNPSLELHLSIFKMSDKETPQQQCTSETEKQRSGEDIMQEGKLSDKTHTARLEKDIEETVAVGENKIQLEETEGELVDSIETSPGKPPLFKAATIEVGDLASKKGKTGCLFRGSSADSGLLIQKGVDKPPLVCVPRQSIINSTFYNQACEGPMMSPREGLLKEKEFIRHRERARRSLMKAGYSQKILSGLREPLLEQFAMEQRMLSHEKPQMDQDGPPCSLKKSVSFDTAKESLRSSFKASSRSRSLDDYKSRSLSVYKGPLLEEVDPDTSKDEPVEANTFDMNIECHSEKPSIEDEPLKGLMDPIKERRKTQEQREDNENPTLVLNSSTKRPLSAPPLESESIIIAVLHQKPRLVSGSVKEGPSSAASCDDESTIIAFLQQKNVPVSEDATTQPSASKCYTDDMKGTSTSQATAPDTPFEGHSIEVGGGVKLTIKTTSETNTFLASHTPTEKSTTPSKSDDYHTKETNIRQETQPSPEFTIEKSIHAVQFSDDNTDIAVMHQGSRAISPSLKKNIATEGQGDDKHGAVTLTQTITAPDTERIQILTPTGQLEEKSTTDTLTAKLVSDSHPARPVSTTQCDGDVTLKTSVYQEPASGVDNQTESPVPQILQDEVKTAAPTVPDKIPFQDVNCHSISKELRSPVYSKEQCAALECLVGEMIYLSEEMNVLVGQQGQMFHRAPPLPPVGKLSKSTAQLQHESHFIETDRGGVAEAPAKEPSPLAQAMKESEATSISQCSFYESLSQAHASPLPHEPFEEFTIESCSSSKTFISHSDSSGTGRRSDNFSDFDEAGRHSEVSLVEITDLLHDSPSTCLERLTIGPFDLEPAQFHVFDLRGRKAFPQETTECERPEGFHVDPSTAVTKQSLHIEEQKHPLIAETFHLSLLQQNYPEQTQHLKGSVFETSVEPKVSKDLETETCAPAQTLPPPSEPHKAATKERKGPTSRKCIKLFRPHGKSSDQSLKQKVKASVANISRIIKGKQGNGQERKEEAGTEEAKGDLPEQGSAVRAIGHAKKKSGLSSFKLANLTAKDKAPAFVEELTDQTVAVGHSVTLPCRTAQPAPQVEWFKDGVAIPSSDRLLISSTLKNYQLLTILAVTAQDLGIYACVVTSFLGSASTCCILKRAEIPCCPTTPEIAQVYEDGALIVWKPVESSTPVTYSLQCRREGDEWRALASDISDCCYSAHHLAEGLVYSFRIACISKAGMGPYSNVSANVKISKTNSASLNLAVREEPCDTAETLERDQMKVKRGRFSVVRPCREKSSGRVLAAKIISYKEEKKESTVMEYLILKKLHHTNIVQLHGAYLSPQHLVLVLELCEGQELLQCLSAGLSYSELEVRDYLWQMLSAVEFLHANQILHLDLRSENTIVTEHKLLKILDFGNAQFYCPDKVITLGRYLDYLETMAPELLEGQGAVPPTDVWAVGITAFFMLSSEYPFSSDTASELEKGIKKGMIKFTRCYAGLSGGAVSFLQSTLWANPWGRPSASDCLKLPWLQEAGLATLQQPPVFFSGAKLRRFVQERRRRDPLARQQVYE